MPSNPARRPLTPPLAPFDRPDVRLFLTSAAVLYAELIFIRWVQDHLFYVGFFNNFVLMASFLGIGVGIVLGRRLPPLPVSPFAAFLYLLAALVYTAQPVTGRLSGEQLLFGQDASDLVNFLIVPAVVVLVTVAMAALALPLGPLLRAMPPLRAYALDIAGALAGITAFVVLAALWSPPVVWFVVLAAILLLLRLGAGLTAWSVAGGVLMACVIGLAYEDSRRGEIWSPYNRIGLHRGYLDVVYVVDEPRPYGDVVEAIEVSGLLNQSLWRARAVQDSFYDEVFRLFPGRSFRRALIVGAGAGTDAAVALAAGVQRVDAVEIDPAIARFGRERHPDRPYDDPRVHVTVDDGRAFLRRSDARYDLVVFAQLGSRALLATSANLRLDTFLVTTEAFASVRDHLEPDGVFVIYYIKDRFATERFSAMLDRTFGAPPLLRTYRHGFGEAHVILAGPGVAPLRASPAGLRTVDRAEHPIPATDDWPFAPIRARELTREYLVALSALLVYAAVIVALSVAATRQPLRGFSPHFFVLGSAFLLLETRSLATYSLLFGTTWIVNALVFFAILSSVLVATAVNALFRLPRAVLYAGLFASVLAGFLVPPATLLVDPPWLRYAAASALAFAPVFFANLVFTYSFRDTPRADLAFASNLLGAVVGGVLEWTALLTGYQNQMLVVGALYLAAYGLATRYRLLADRNPWNEDARRAVRVIDSHVAGG